MKHIFTIQELETMSERSLLFEAIKDEMKRRGHWKNRNRGINRSNQELQKSGFTALSMQQSSADNQINDFSDGL